jgi:hypothetical protein
VGHSKRRFARLNEGGLLKRRRAKIQIPAWNCKMGRLASPEMPTRPFGERNRTEYDDAVVKSMVVSREDNQSGARDGERSGNRPDSGFTIFAILPSPR